MHFGDSIFIFLLALVLFGPKKLPEIGRQIGKLLAEFRRASNDFKFQIDEELRAMEQTERQKQLDQAAAQTNAAEPAAAPQLPAETATSGPVIQPPSTGETVSSTAWPYGGMPKPEDTDPSYKEAVAQEEKLASLAVEQAESEAAADGHTENSESEQAPIHHG